MTSLTSTVAALAAKPGDFVEVAEVTRGGLVESRHRGIAALTDPEGHVIDSCGYTKRLIYPRSAIKPLQTVAMMRAGLSLSGAELAITSASHRGTNAHIALVRSLLEKAGLDESALQCPDGIKFNCSGKHSGFLAASMAHGWSTHDYLSIDHPLQRLIIEVLEEFSGEKILQSTVDGCGAPLHAMTVEGIARATGKLAATETALVDALTSNGWVISNHGIADAILLDAGFVAKNGAEGVFAVGARTGHGLAIKIADGNLRAAPLLAIKMLHENGLLGASHYRELREALAVPSLGGGVPQGELHAL
ncbi:MAG: asparaginase [Micrococcales bacterium]